MLRVAAEASGKAANPFESVLRAIALDVDGLDLRPQEVISEDGFTVRPDLVDRERRIFSEQAAASGKPENIIQKMVDGRIDKYYKEVTVLDQPWVRDDSKTIRDLVKAAGSGATIRRFARFQIGQE